MAKKERLDVLLVEKGYFPNRTKAKSAVMAGMILVDGELVDKAGSRIPVEASLEIKGNNLPYVSRGGMKLAKALQVFSVDPSGQEVLDIGASTGGFTDCLLQHGASKVFAVDVGYGQLAWKLRKDERVELYERTNFRYLTTEELPHQVALIVIDVSFISLSLIIPKALDFLWANGEIIALIKPQFEAGPERVGKNGLVSEQKVHIDILTELSLFLTGIGLDLIDLDYSPLTGAGSKNIEFLIHLKYSKNIKQDHDLSRWEQKIAETVSSAHLVFGGG